MIEVAPSLDLPTRLFREAFGILLAEAWAYEFKGAAGLPKPSFKEPGSRPKSYLWPTVHVDGHWPRWAEMELPLPPDFWTSPIRGRIFCQGSFDQGEFYQPHRDKFREAWGNAKSIPDQKTWRWGILLEAKPARPPSQSPSQVEPARQTAPRFQIASQVVRRWVEMKGKDDCIALVHSAEAPSRSQLVEWPATVQCGGFWSLLSRAHQCHQLIVPNNPLGWWFGFLSHARLVTMVKSSRKG